VPAVHLFRGLKDPLPHHLATAIENIVGGSPLHLGSLQQEDLGSFGSKAQVVVEKPWLLGKGGDSDEREEEGGARLHIKSPHLAG